MRVCGSGFCYRNNMQNQRIGGICPLHAHGAAFYQFFRGCGSPEAAVYAYFADLAGVQSFADDALSARKGVWGAGFFTVTVAVSGGHAMGAPAKNRSQALA